MATDIDQRSSKKKKMMQVTFIVLFFLLLFYHTVIRIVHYSINLGPSKVTKSNSWIFAIHQFWNDLESQGYKPHNELDGTAREIRSKALALCEEIMDKVSIEIS